jgi:RecB family exonuclease
VGKPPGFPFLLNSAVDALLKKEFDLYRDQRKPHPLMEKYGLDAVPFVHDKLDEWRDSLRRGIQFHDTETNLIITGGVDDVWINAAVEIIIVDYKATSKNGPVSIDADWQVGYKRQMSLYAWLFKKNGFSVHHTGYFVYCNGLTSNLRFDEKLEFEISLLPYRIEDGWVEEAIRGAHGCLKREAVPVPTEECDYCRYVLALKTHELTDG